MYLKASLAPSTLFVRMDIELNRRSKSSEARATFEIKSVDAVPGGSSAPGQVPKGVKSTTEPNP